MSLSGIPWLTGAPFYGSGKPLLLRAGFQMLRICATSALHRTVTYLEIASAARAQIGHGNSAMATPPLLISVRVEATLEGGEIEIELTGMLYRKAAAGKTRASGAASPAALVTLRRSGSRRV